eukprot:11785379-Ditylum_brightwellii.AAC.1
MATSSNRELHTGRQVVQVPGKLLTTRKAGPTTSTRKLARLSGKSLRGCLSYAAGVRFLKRPPW